jgi:AcrR family transcriptional regulator
MARTTGSDGEKTRSAIDAAAKRLIAKIGYEAMTMRLLADEVGVQSAAFYRYYPNKQELLFSLMRDHMDRLLDAWEYESRKVHTPFERLSAFIRFHIRYHVERRDDVHIGNMELRSLVPLSSNCAHTTKTGYVRYWMMVSMPASSSSKTLP